MVLTYSVYILLAFVCLWKGKFNNDFNDDFLDKRYTKSICGIAALFIIFHHISQQPAFQDYTRELYFFNNIGYLAVCVFLFFSGYGLTTKVKQDKEYVNTFLAKRLITVLLPFYLTNIIFVILNIGAMPLPRLLLGIFGFVNVNPNGWYPVTQTVLYLAFYVSNKLFKKDRSKILFELFVVIALICIFCVNGHFAWWYAKKGWWLRDNAFNNVAWWADQQVLLFSGEWWVNSAISFVLGTTLASYRNSIINWLKKNYYIKLIISVMLFVASYLVFTKINNDYGYWSELWHVTPQIGDKFITSFSQLFVCVFFIITLVMIMMKYEVKNPITSFMGNITYETYLIGYILLDVFSFLILNKKYYQPIVSQPFNYNLIVYTLCVLSTTILFGYLLNRLDNYLIKKIQNRYSISNYRM